MALLTCKECKKEFSNECKKCPHCGSTKHKSFFKKHPIISIFIGLFCLSLISTIVRGPQSSAISSPEKLKTKVEVNDGSNTTEALKNVTLDYKWSKGGFENILMIDATIKNDNPYPVKDLTISCIMIAKSGTSVGDKDKVLLDIVNANGTLVIKKFNMGFMNTQTDSTSCSISHVNTAARNKALGLE